MQYRDIFIKEVYYISKIIVNLLCNHNLLISDYWIEFQQQDYSFKVIKQSTDNMTDFIIILNWLYVIHIWKLQSQIESSKIERSEIERSVKKSVIAVILDNFLHFWHLWLEHVNYQVVLKMTQISMLKVKLSFCYLCLTDKQTEQHNKIVSQFQVSRILKFVHINLEKYYLKSLSDHQYFLIIIDNFTCYN